MATVLDRIESFLDVPATDRSLVVVDADGSTPLSRLLETAFEAQSVSVTTDVATPGLDASVLLLDGNEVVATSPLDSLVNGYLLVNSDNYRTGVMGLDEYEAPAVLRALSETRFRLRGYPASNKEKLLLVVLSRFIERQALAADDGTLHASFQRLSRLDDEHGTRRVYSRLGESGVETHIYGVPDHSDPPDGLHVHAGTTPPYRRTWFVVYRSGSADETSALVSLERADNEWDGLWTFDGERVATAAGILDDLD
ncbi:DICT sensory domain-containing protein [Halosegnis marinus]|uniref:DICT sensory domain-containing protein n=1 Tax=Halosegnis marinus TaxID=3034023 RepID=A0ABD5ZQ54_9EURY|nr:DICT sensory domain-containing protein [Halosegnis sp. DT85]